MRNVIQTSLILTLLTLSGTTNSQVMRRQMDSSNDGIFHLKEIQLIISSSDDTVAVNMVLPEHMRLKEYQDIKVEEEDKILMVNAKRVKHVDELKEIYEDAKIGDSIKFGINRKGELFLVDFKKADPEDMPKGRIRIMTPGDRMDSGNVYPLMGTGLILEEAHGQVLVQDKMEMGGLAKEDILEGDVITGINAKEVKSLGDIREAYEDLKPESKIELSYLRKDKMMSLSFKKPDISARLMRQQ